MRPDPIEIYVAKLGVAAIRVAIQTYGKQRVIDDITAGFSKAITRIEDGDEREVVELAGVIHLLGEDEHAENKVDPAQKV